MFRQLRASSMGVEMFLLLPAPTSGKQFVISEVNAGWSSMKKKHLLSII